MSDAPETWSDVGSRLTGTRFTDVRRVSEIDSTNRWMADAAREGAPEGLVLVADHQTAGRGRLGRSWEAPPGASLLVSALIRPSLRAERIHVLTMASGLAMADAVFLVADFAPSLKWPNDLVVGDRKLAGMLSEVDVAEGQVRAVVVGIGVNVNWTAFPPEIAETATACNVVAGREVSRDDLLVTFLDALDQRIGSLGTVDGERALLAEYRTRCSTLGRRVRVELPGGGVLEGIARDVDDEGALVVDDGTGASRVVSAGDVIHVRPVIG